MRQSWCTLAMDPLHLQGWYRGSPSSDPLRQIRHVSSSCPSESPLVGGGGLGDGLGGATAAAAAAGPFPLSSGIGDATGDGDEEPAEVNAAPSSSASISSGLNLLPLFSLSMLMHG